MRKNLAALVVVCLLVTQAFSQSRTLTGTITDPSGVPISGASIIAKPAGTGTTTNEYGKYSITISAQTKTLEISSLNFVVQAVPVSNKAIVNVQLQAATSSLSEVVVIGYGTQKRKEVTGSIASIKGSDVASKPVQTFEQALGGRAAGVQVTIPSGVLNATPVIRIRGTNSISLSSFPLFVIDGVPSFTGDFSGTSSAGNALASINPNDIESIDIAKDAAATAIYGSRAANGVVFVTTKKGKSGKARVSVDSWVGLSQVQRLPPMLDAFQYTDYKNEALTNAGTFNATTNNFALTNGPDGKPINTLWSDFVYRDAIQHSHTISMSGANDATNYYFSAGFTDQQGIIRRNDFSRVSALMNFDHKPNKFINLGGKLQYSNEGNFAAVSSGSLGDAFSTAGLGRVALVTAPNISPFNNNGTYNFSGALIGVMGNKQGQVGFNNPVIQLDQNRGNSETNHILGNFYVQVKPFNWLTLRSNYGIDYIYVDNESYFSPTSGEGFSSNGSATSTYSKNKRTVWSNTAQFDYTFASKHNTSLLVGVEEQISDNNSFGVNRVGVNDPEFKNIQGGWQTPNAAGLGIGENYLYSEFGRVQYNYDLKYFLTANLRRDGASQLGAQNKFGTFYGVSAGWEITKETFWANANLDKVFSSFKLRSSYGKVGNIGGLGNFASLSTFGSGLYGGAGTVAFNDVGNNLLQWETSKKFDAGVSFGFFNEKLRANIDYFKNNIDGLLLFVPQPPSAGLPSAIPQNIGSMYNNGVEIEISGTPVSNTEVTWNSSFNISFNKNEVNSLAVGIDQIVAATGGLENPSITKPGNPIGMLFVTRTNGVDPASGKRIFLNKAGREVYFQHVAPAGQFRFAFADGTVAPSVSAADAVVFRNTNPKFFGGFSNTFTYRGFTLDALFTFQGGNYIYYGTNAGLRDQRFWNNSTDVLSRWQKPGEVTEIPKPIFGDNISNGSAFPLDINVFKGDFIKLRTATMSYNVKNSLLQKANISSLRFYVSGNNLLFITEYPGPDPEVSSNGNGATNFGIDRNTVANQRSFTVGVNVNF